MTTPSQSRRLLLIIAYIGFISLGLPDPLIGVAWPGVRRDFGLPVDAVAWVFLGFGLSYFVSSLLTGRLLKTFGVGLLLAGSSALVAAGGFGFALAPVWVAFALCSLLHGLGSGAIDSGLNHYVAHHFSARHMNWLHACYSLGATFGPLIMTAMIGAWGSWRAGYAAVAGILLVLSLLFAATRRRWDGPGETLDEEEAAASSPLTLGQVLRRGAVWFHILLFFLYVGLEIMIGQWSYSVLTESRGVTKEIAGLWVTIYWAGIGVGRVLLGFVVDHLGVDRVVRGGLGVAAAGAALFALDLSLAASAFALVLLGLGLAPIFPCLMTRTPQRFGSAVAAHAIGAQVSAGMAGAALLPSLAGMLGKRWGLESIAVAAVTIALVLFSIHEILLVWQKRSSTSSDAALPRSP